MVNSKHYLVLKTFPSFVGGNELYKKGDIIELREKLAREYVKKGFLQEHTPSKEEKKSGEIKQYDDGGEDAKSGTSVTFNKTKDSKK